MLEGLTNSIKLNLPTANTLFCVGAVALAGRKFCIAGSYKICSKIAQLVGNQHYAVECDKVSDEYWKLARKDAFRDVTALAGFIAALSVMGEVKKRIKFEEEAKNSWIMDWVKKNSVTTASLVINVLHAIDVFTFSSTPYGRNQYGQDVYYPRGCFLWRPFQNKFLIGNKGYLLQPQGEMKPSDAMDFFAAYY